HTATYVAVRDMHPEIDGSVAQIPAALADNWWEALDDLDEATDRVQQLRSKIAERMGEARLAKRGEQKVAYRQRPAHGGRPFVKTASRPSFQTIIEARKGHESAALRRAATA